MVSLMTFDFIALGEVADITKLAGFEFTKYIKYNNSGEIIALRALNLRHGELDLTDIKRIDKSVSEILPRSKLYSGDILLTYTGNGYETVLSYQKMINIILPLTYARLLQISKR